MDAFPGNMKIKDLYESDVQATNDHDVDTLWHVTGTFNPINKWTELPESQWQKPVDAKNGSLFYTVLIPEDQKSKELKIYSKATLEDAYKSVPETTGTINDQELFWVLNVTEKPVIRFDIDDEVFAEFDFSQIRRN